VGTDSWSIASEGQTRLGSPISWLRRMQVWVCCASTGSTPVAPQRPYIQAKSGSNSLLDLRQIHPRNVAEPTPALLALLEVRFDGSPRESVSHCHRPLDRFFGMSHSRLLAFSLCHQNVVRSFPPDTFVLPPNSRHTDQRCRGDRCERIGLDVALLAARVAEGQSGVCPLSRQYSVAEGG
jgi:hypothetical protein